MTDHDGPDPLDMSEGDIATEIIDLNNRLNLKTTLMQAVRAGTLLLEIKARVGHGNYLPWCKRHGLAPRTCQRYVQCALAGNASDKAHLTLEQFLLVVRRGRRQERQRKLEDAFSRLPDVATETGIVCADSLDYMRSMPSESVPCVLSDPPYGIGLKYDGWTEPDNPTDYWAWFEPYFTEMKRIVAPGGAIILWQAQKYLGYLNDWFKPTSLIASCFHARGIALWEPMVFVRKPGDWITRNVTMNDWFSTPNTLKNPNYRSHPCPKQYEAARAAVTRYTLKASMVFDPFCGIGTIPLAAHNEGRSYLGIERNVRYADIARKRLLQAKVAA